ncbi:hypothetical protein AAFF_G00336120 [Aldrovandia affinis]|uniref:Uncharacterized protein n=1 Tax=Aldrovandia affinis TaxID=143900 RepID=A0AAD7SLE8_9TELE|nr:hypothetical protein AAFF_G00336120 [Aldrovandia affinis]
MFQECVNQLHLRSLVSVSMDGPNVNWKFLDLLQEEHAQLYGGKQLVTVGSCGLHTLHNAFKCGFVAWGLDRLLKAMHTLFNNVPARRENYMQVTKSSVFPLSFCAHRWVENLPVVERALAVWPSLLIYMEAVRTKKAPNPGTGSYDTIAAAIKDPLILAKLHFYMAIARTFTPFLKRYQTDEPVMPFLGRDLAEFLKSLLRRFIKRELLQDATTVQLTRLDITERKNWVRLQDVDIGLGAESILKVMLYWSSSVLSCPLRGEKLLILSHGQASVERGFSVNKEVETTNIMGDTVVARRLVCDYVALHGGVTKVPLTKELLKSVEAARTRYRDYLTEERRKKELEAKGQKRKAAEDDLEELRKRKKTILEVSQGLAREADKTAEEAEAKSGTKMAELISKSNILRKGSKKKLAELEILEKEIEAKGAELRKIE